MENVYESELYPIAKGFSTINWIITSRDNEFIAELKDVCNNLATGKRPKPETIKTITVYDVFSGSRSCLDDKKVADSFKNDNSEVHLDIIKQFYNSTKAEYTNLVIKDAHNIKDQKIWRALINSIEQLTVETKKIFLLSHQDLPYPEFGRRIYVYNHGLPSYERRLFFIDSIFKEFKKDKNKLRYCDEKELAQISAGLTLNEINMGIRKSIGMFYADHAIDIDFFREFKEESIKKTSKLTFVHSDTKLEDIGGLDRAKKYVINRFDESKSHLPKSGIIFFGLSGGGKSKFAEAVGNYLKVPVIAFNMSSIFNKAVGESEKAMRAAIETVDATGKCLVFLDELEKVIGGVVSSNRTDGGTANRVFEILLQWLAKNKECYIIATSNNLEDLPAEFLRARRWDMIFFVDFPSKKEVKNIFEMKCKKFGITKIQKHYELLLETDVFNDISGAEIEQLVLEYAFIMDKDENGNWEDAINCVAKLSDTQKDKLLLIRKMGKKYISASEPDNDNESLIEEKLDDESLSVDENGEIIKNKEKK